MQPTVSHVYVQLERMSSVNNAINSSSCHAVFSRLDLCWYMCSQLSWCYLMMPLIYTKAMTSDQSNSEYKSNPKYFHHNIFICVLRIELTWWFLKYTLCGLQAWWEAPGLKWQPQQSFNHNWSLFYYMSDLYSTFLISYQRQTNWLSIT